VRSTNWILISFVACTLCLPSISSAQNTRSLLTQAIVAFGQGKLDGALTALDGAEASTNEPSFLSKIHRQRGIILEVQDEVFEAMIQFRKAVYYNPNLSLSSREHKGRVSDLFQCAKNMDVAGIKESMIRTKFASSVKDGNIECPIDSSGNIIPKKEPETPKPPTTNPELTSTPPPPPPKLESNWLSSPTFWIITSLAVAGSATAAGFYFIPPSGGDYGGSSDTTIRLSD